MWVIPDYGYHIGPLEAYYIKNNGQAEAVLVPSTNPAPPPSRELVAGLNLFGPAPPYENSTFIPQTVEESLITGEGRLPAAFPGKHHGDKSGAWPAGMGLYNGHAGP